MEKEILLPYNVEKNLNLDEKKKYYYKIRNYCNQLSLFMNSNINFGQSAISKLYLKSFYDSKLQITGLQNIPKNSPVIITCNHSTAHDIFSMYIAMEKLGLSSSVMVATDCLNILSKTLFSLADSVFLDRRDKLSSSNSILQASATVLSGKNLVIFGESTWNLHPVKVMQDLKRGSSMISAITGVPVIPTILEYIENPILVDNEIEIYKKVILRFGQPYFIKETDDMSFMTMKIQNEMEKLRKIIWKENNISRQNILSVNKEIYLNHTYLKKFGVFGFEYNSAYESQFLRSNDGKSLIENEFCLNDANEFVPGITYRKRKK